MKMSNKQRLHALAVLLVIGSVGVSAWAKESK
jgi:hypothetical protein